MPDYELVANVSLLFGELPFPDRFAAAANAGFQAVEFWWPFGPAPVPAAGEVTTLLDAITAAGIPLVGMNLWAGDQPAGERGMVANPFRRDDFVASLGVAAQIAQETGCRVHNALYGQRLPGLEDQRTIARDNLARAMETLPGTLLIEPLSRGSNGAYLIETVAEAQEVIVDVRALSGGENLALLFDTFHLTSNGEDLLGTIRANPELIGHVQLADAPGRGEPGTGTIDFVAVLDALADSGYRGAVAAEYLPSGPTLETLGWVANTPHLALSR